MSASHESPRVQRADALDALRGFAILTMVLSGLVPRGGLPAWMYHAQLPPPDHKFDPTLPGLTWVDLVFPFFLFAMGAAFPMAFARRLAAGVSAARLALQAGLRGLILLAFAIYVQHLNPWLIEKSPGGNTWLACLLGFALLFPAIGRFPFASRGGLAAWLGLTGRVAAWLAATALVVAIWYRETDFAALASDPAAFWSAVKTVAGRSDIIIVVLANCAAFGSWVWLATRHEWALRVAVLVALIALRLAAGPDGWVRSVWNWSPLPALHQVYFLQYLLVVIPGMLAGDAFQQWLRDAAGEQDRASRAGREAARGDGSSAARPAWLAGGALLLLVLVVCALQARWPLAWAGPLAIAAAAGLAWFSRGPGLAAERLLQALVGWGGVWLAIGLLFEPYEGGIKKDHPTLSYYFVTSGLACYGLVVLVGWGQAFGRRAGLWLLCDNGQNPMIAYAGIRALLPPLLGLTGIEALVAGWQLGPWAGFGWACLKTLLLALLVSGVTRLRVFWRT